MLLTLAGFRLNSRTSLRQRATANFYPETTFYMPPFTNTTTHELTRQAGRTAESVSVHQSINHHGRYVVQGDYDTEPGLLDVEK
jgi:hypothetical protein